MAYFKEKMKTNGDKESPSFRPFWIRNKSQRFLPCELYYSISL